MLCTSTPIFILLFKIIAFISADNYFADCNRPICGLYSPQKQHLQSARASVSFISGLEKTVLYLDLSRGDAAVFLFDGDDACRREYGIRKSLNIRRSSRLRYIYFLLQHIVGYTPVAEFCKYVITECFLYGGSIFSCFGFTVVSV